MATYLIENVDCPGHYWSSKFTKFCSEFGDDYKVYRTKAAALRAAGNLSKVYRVRLVEYSHGQRAFETAMGMRGYSGSSAEREVTK